MAGVRDGQFDEVGRQSLEFLAIGDGVLKSRGVLGCDALGDIGPLAPDLMLEVRAGFEAALLHGLERCHLFKNARSLGEEL